MILDPLDIPHELLEAREQGRLVVFAGDRRLLGKGRGKWATLSWDAMIAGEPNQEMHRSFPIKKVAPKRKVF